MLGGWLRSCPCLLPADETKYLVNVLHSESPDVASLCSPPTLVMLRPPLRPALTLETVSGVSSHHNTELGPSRRGGRGRWLLRLCVKSQLLVLDNK